VDFGAGPAAFEQLLAARQRDDATYRDLSASLTATDGYLGAESIAVWMRPKAARPSRQFMASDVLSLFG
jgi:hypothetical protein